MIQFNIDLYTSIVKKDKERVVIKTPRSWIAKRHIKNIYQNYLYLSSLYKKKSIYFNYCKLDKSSIKFEYIDGKNLSFIISNLYLSKNYDRIYQEYDKVILI